MSDVIELKHALRKKRLFNIKIVAKMLRELMAESESEYEIHQIKMIVDHIDENMNFGISYNDKKKRKHISKSIRHEVFLRDDYKCCECGATKENTSLHIDHIVSVSQGGSDEMSNLQTLCEQCNLSKSSRSWKSKPHSNLAEFFG